MSGRLVAVEITMKAFSSASKAFDLDQQLIERLLTLVMTAAQTGAAMAADRVDLIHEDDARRNSAWPARTGHAPASAPTPTNISIKSEPEIEKNCTPASPANRSQCDNGVLPVPGGP